MSHLSLLAPGPHPSLGKHAETYGRFIGSWVGEYEDHMEDGRIESGSMEVHFFWVLEGLAVQDVWIAPKPRGNASHTRDTYGTTVRVFDPAAQLWRVVWLNPKKNVRYDLVGQQVGDEVIQLGVHGDRQTKWLFTQITASSFVWRGYVMDKDGESWRLHTEFRLRRAP
jgi:hypothetical protein